MVPKLAGAFSAIRRGIHLAQAAYPQRLKRVHVVGAAPFFFSSLQLMRSCVNEKVRRRVSAGTTRIICVILFIFLFHNFNATLR